MALIVYAYFNKTNTLVDNQSLVASFNFLNNTITVKVKRATDVK